LIFPVRRISHDLNPPNSFDQDPLNKNEFSREESAEILLSRKVR
jgi:hypothetical protein